MEAESVTLLIVCIVFCHGLTNESYYESCETFESLEPGEPQYFTRKYRMQYAIYVKEAQNHTESPPADEYICQLASDEKLKICKEAMVDQKAVVCKMELVNDTAVENVKTYEISLGGWPHLNKPPVYERACLCPTEPPIYLRNNSTGKFVDAYIAFRQKYGEVPDCAYP